MVSGVVVALRLTTCIIRKTQDPTNNIRIILIGSLHRTHKQTGFNAMYIVFHNECYAVVPSEKSAQTGAGLNVNMMLSPNMVGVLSKYANSILIDLPSGLPISVTNAVAGAPYLDTARAGIARAAMTVVHDAVGCAPTQARLST